MAGRLLVAGLFGNRLRVFDLGAGGSTGASPALLAEALTRRHPVQVMVSGHAVHVSEAKGLGWALCMAGARCGPGRRVEVFRLDPEAGTLTLQAHYGGADRGAPYLASWRDWVVEPRLANVRLYRAEVTQ